MKRGLPVTGELERSFLKQGSGAKGMIKRSLGLKHAPL
jgi:hypothetical protein